MPSDITHELVRVHGGNRGRAIASAARVAWQVARPFVMDAVETVGTVAGTVALERAVDYVRGR